MKPLDDAELKMATDITTQMARSRGQSFDQRAAALKLCRAALADESFRARLAEIYRRLTVHRASTLPRKLLAPLAPLFRDLERDAAQILDQH